jgi:N-acetylglucosamine kinase-like BadF-type ATPase
MNKVIQENIIEALKKSGFKITNFDFSCAGYEGIYCQDDKGKQYSFWYDFGEM